MAASLLLGGSVDIDTGPGNILLRHAMIWFFECRECMRELCVW